MRFVLSHSDIFWSGLQLSLLLAVISGVLSLMFGSMLAIMRVSPVPILRRGATVYVEIVRNTPLTILFFFAAFVLPQLGVKFSYFTFAVIALSVYYTAFFCEAVRSGFNAVPIGQAEAARSIGLSMAGVLRMVVLPQVFRSVIPPLISVFIALIKNTAVASAFGVAELLTVMEQLANDHSASVIPILLATAFLYLAITIPAGLVAGHVERRMAIRR